MMFSLYLIIRAEKENIKIIYVFSSNRLDTKLSAKRVLSRDDDKSNYRGISLMSIAAKVYNRVLLNRIRDTHHHHHTRDARKRFHSIIEASIIAMTILYNALLIMTNYSIMR